jgi:hypothetical protein
MPIRSYLMIFLKTHPIAARAKNPGPPRAFEKISDATTPWFALESLLMRLKTTS